MGVRVKHRFHLAQQFAVLVTNLTSQQVLPIKLSRHGRGQKTSVNPEDSAFERFGRITIHNAIEAQKEVVSDEAGSRDGHFLPFAFCVLKEDRVRQGYVG